MHLEQRRQILELTTKAAFSIFLPVSMRHASAQSADKAYRPKEFVERVNAQWVSDHENDIARTKEDEKRGEFASLAPPGQLVPFGDWDYYYTKGTRANWTPNPGQPFKSVYVPDGFVTDLTSIPQAAWSLGMKPEGRYAYAALIHDYLYWTQEPSRSREEADKIFLFAMEDWKVSVAEREGFFQILRVVGGLAWERNATLKKHGERRILKVRPDDLSISWDVWKKKPGVFSE